ncbi:MAG: hypothetical protein HY303_18580 [Candidatus Wallbacteria bacterium]|nr:hypothetical protein [Candidatus Wallbacteria bacterium]
MSLRSTILPFLALFGLPVWLAAGAAITLSPATVRVDAEFRLQVKLSYTADLYGAGLDLVYDPSKLAVADSDGNISNGVQPSVSEGAFLNSGGTTSTLRAEALQDSRPGRLVLGLTRRGRVAGASSSQERTLLSVGFRALTSGTTRVHVENAVLFDSRSDAGQPIATSEATLVAVVATTNHPPVLRLPANVQTRPGIAVLDASESFDPDEDTLTYSWEQKSGSPVTLSSTSTAAIYFTLGSASVASFELAISDGAATVRQSVVVSASSDADSPPRAVVASPGSGKGVFAIAFSLLDAESDSADVVAEFSTDGGATFHPATSVAGAEPLQGLAATPSGAPHQFVWNSIGDVGTVRLPAVLFRLTPSSTRSGALGVAAVSDAFPVDDSGATMSVRIFAPVEGASLISGETFALRGEAFDAQGIRIGGAGLEFSSDRDGVLGTGSPLIASLKTIGDHRIRLLARDAQGRTATTSELVRVEPVPPPPLRMVFTGRVASSMGLPAPDGSQIVLFNTTRGISGSGRIGGGDGTYQAVLGSLTKSVAALGDMVTFDLVDDAGVPRVLTPSGITLATQDIDNRLRLQDLVFDISTSVSFAQGLNLICLPADPGTPAGPYSSTDLLRDSGAFFVARAVAGRLDVYLPDGTTPAWNVRGNQGYLLGAARDRTFTYAGKAWPPSDRLWILSGGYNILSFPFGVPSGFTTGDVLTLSGSDWIVEYDQDRVTRTQRARPFLRGLERDPTPVRLGRGYLVRTRQPTTLAIPTAGGQ